MAPSSRTPDQRRLESHLRALRAHDVRSLAARHRIDVSAARRKAEVIEILVSSSQVANLLADVESLQSGTVAYLRDQLAATQDSIHEAANLGAPVAAAEDAWTSAGEALDRGLLRETEGQLVRASRLAEEARNRRIRDIEGSLSSIDDHILLARAVGAEVDEAARLQAEAREALTARSYVEAGDLAKRAERIAMEGQQRKIEQAMQLRDLQIEKAMAVIASCEPLLQEAESYDLDPAEVRTLLRQARDVLARGDYVAGLTFAHNAEEASQRLEWKIDAERRRRGIERPGLGLCGVCGSGRLTFYDDGWGRCGACQGEFRWRGPLGLRERIRELLGT